MKLGLLCAILAAFSVPCGRSAAGGRGGGDGGVYGGRGVDPGTRQVAAGDGRAAGQQPRRERATEQLLADQRAAAAAAATAAQGGPPPTAAESEAEAAGRLFLEAAERQLEERSYFELVRVLTGHATGRYSGADVLKFARHMFGPDAGERHRPELLEELLTFIPDDEPAQEQPLDEDDVLEVSDPDEAEDAPAAPSESEIAAKELEIGRAQQEAARKAHEAAFARAEQERRQADEEARKQAAAARAAWRTEANRLLEHAGSLAALPPEGSDGGPGAVEPGEGGLVLTEAAAKLVECWWAGHHHETLATLLSGLLRSGRSMLPEEGAILFRGFDADGDGMLSLAEWQELFRAVASHDGGSAGRGMLATMTEHPACLPSPPPPPPPGSRSFGPTEPLPEEDGVESARMAALEAAVAAALTADHAEHATAAEGASADSEEASRALFTAARTGDADAVQKHLAAGVPVDRVWCQDTGLTPLHAAAMGGHAEVLAALLEHGAHPLRKMGASPRTALDLLPRKHHVKGTRAYKLLREAMVKHKMNLNDEL